MTFRSKGLKRRADGSLVNEDYLICDSYQRGRGCGNGYHFNYRIWEQGILDATLLDAFDDRHFASPNAVRALEIELAERERACAADRSRAETALALLVETNRPDVKELWSKIVRAVDDHDIAIGDLRVQLVAARGAVSPEEHRRRIFALRDTHEDEDVRFRTRSRIAEAVHELVATMSFSADPLGVLMSTRDGGEVEVSWEEWGRQAGTAWTISAPR